MSSVIVIAVLLYVISLLFSLLLIFSLSVVFRNLIMFFLILVFFVLFDLPQSEHLSFLFNLINGLLLFLQIFSALHSCNFSLFLHELKGHECQFDIIPKITVTLSIFFFKFNFLFYIVVQLIYNVVLVSGVQQSDSVTHTHIPIFFRFFSLIGYYKILSIVACAIQQILVGYLFYIQQCVYMLITNS